MNIMAGHNNPPSPFEDSVEQIATLYEQAQQFLDGEEIATQGLADSVADLLNMIRKAGKTADSARKLEVEPLNTEKAAIQAKYKPLADRCKLASTAAKKALQPWLILQERLAQEEAARMREIADKAAEESRVAMASRDASKLEDQEEADKLANDAKWAKIRADKAAKIKPKTGNTGRGKAISLRDVHTPTVISMTEAAKYCWSNHRDEIEGEIIRLIQGDVRGGKRNIPGVEVITTKEAV